MQFIQTAVTIFLILSSRLMAGDITCPTGDVIEFTETLNPKQKPDWEKLPDNYKKFARESREYSAAELDTLDTKLPEKMKASFPKADFPLVHEITPLMYDIDAFQRWFDELVLDVGVSMSKSKDPKVLKMLSEGKIHPKYWEKTLNERAIKQGFGPIKKVNESVSNTDFAVIIEKGELWYDVHFKKQHHGAYSHALGMLYIDFASGGKGKAFMKLMGKESKNFEIWTTLFDSGSNNITCPEFINNVFVKPLGFLPEP